MVVTFLPYPDIEKSIACLDRTRINKQKLEARQILTTLNDGGRWSNHPATLMWEGHEDLLAVYYNACIDECEKRGYSNTMEKIDVHHVTDRPWWWGWEHLHRSHQASLHRKHPFFYETVFPDLSSFYKERGYVWPSKLDPSFIGRDDDEIFAPINKETMRSAHKSKELLYTVVDLRRMCREKGITGTSKMKKAELMEVLQL